VNADEFESDWPPENRAGMEDELRRDFGRNDVYLLDDPEFVRVGDRFGSYILQTDGKRSYRVFIDDGPYLPRSERPAAARVPWPPEDVERYGPQPTTAELPITDEEYSDWLCDQSDEDWRRGNAVFRLVMRAAHLEVYPRLMEMRYWLANQDPMPLPVLTVRCSSPRRKKPCRQVLAALWQTDHGLYGVADVAPSKTADTVLKGWGTTESQVLAGTRVSYVFSPEDVDPGVDDMVMLACPDHANVEVSAELLVTEAHSTRRTLNIDTMTKVVS
jgi:hypothetical protein